MVRTIQGFATIHCACGFNTHMFYLPILLQCRVYEIPRLVCSASSTASRLLPLAVYQDQYLYLINCFSCQIQQNGLSDDILLGSVIYAFGHCDTSRTFGQLFDLALENLGLITIVHIVDFHHRCMTYPSYNKKRILNFCKMRFS